MRLPTSTSSNCKTLTVTNTNKTLLAAEQIFHKKNVYIFAIAVRPAVSGLVALSAANRECTGWLKDRVLKPARKLSLVVTFVPRESARPDQIADLIKELYNPNRCTACRLHMFLKKLSVLTGIHGFKIKKELQLLNKRNLVTVFWVSRNKIMEYTEKKVSNSTFPS